MCKLSHKCIEKCLDIWFDDFDTLTIPLGVPNEMNIEASDQCIIGAQNTLSGPF